MDRTQTDATTGDSPNKTTLQRSIDNYLRTRMDSYAFLGRNPVLPERATEELPDDTADRPAQQFRSDAQRQQIVRYTRDRAYRAVDEQGYGALVERRDHALVPALAYTGVHCAEVLRYPNDDRAMACAGATSILTDRVLTNTL